MSNYILRQIPPSIWQRVKDRARSDDIPLRGLFLWLLLLYVEGKIDIEPVKRICARGSSANADATRTEHATERHDG